MMLSLFSSCAQGPGRVRRSVALAGALGSVAAFGTGVASPASAATTCAIKDVIGAPAYKDAAGAVDVRLTNGAQRLITRSDLSGAGDSAAGDRFGAAVQADCDRVWIGAPGVGGSGAVYVIRFHDGLLRTGVVGKFKLAGAAPGDDFGAAIAVSGSRLWVGAPLREVGGSTNAGVVVEHALTSEFPPVAGSTRVVSQGSGAPGGAEAGDRFGEVLAAAPGGSVVVGTPRENVGDVSDAGMVTVLGRGSGAWTQNSSGVPGSAEAGDRFGGAVAASGSTMAVGAPGEDSSIANVGSVQLFNAKVADGAVTGWSPSYAVSQDTSGVPGVGEADDGFGSALAFASQFVGTTCGVDLAIGASGEDVASVADAGSVTIIDAAASSPSRSACPAVGATQSGALSGRAQAGDRVGTAIAAQISDPAGPATALTIGVPGEDVETATDAGLVHYLKPVPAGGGSGSTTMTGGAAASARLGSELG